MKSNRTQRESHANSLDDVAPVCWPRERRDCEPIPPQATSLTPGQAGGKEAPQDAGGAKAQDTEEPCLDGKGYAVTKKQAKAQGLEFTGIYAFSTEKDDIKRQAKEIRQSGRRAVTVYVPGSRRDGYAIYAEPED